MNDNKYFMITIDTEADNQWDYNHEFTTENVKYLPRFQELAEKYNYRPTWLTTYEMVENDYFVKYFKEKQNKKLCEIGMHLHAWNTPPEYKLEKKTNERSYLIEYPTDIMEEKIKNIDDLITYKFGTKPISHRAGRWAMNDDYFKILEKYGYKIDCSVTPHINWSTCLGTTGRKGIDYSKEPENEKFCNKILEIPVTIRKIRLFKIRNITSFKRLLKEIKLILFGKYQWIRPDKTFSEDGIIKVIDKCYKKNEYIMFMIHSSELMPGGSPNFKTKKDIENLYRIIETIFSYSKNLGYKGITLKDYYYLKEGDKGE